MNQYLLAGLIFLGIIAVVVAILGIIAIRNRGRKYWVREDGKSAIVGYNRLILVNKKTGFKVSVRKTGDEVYVDTVNNNISVSERSRIYVADSVLTFNHTCDDEVIVRWEDELYHPGLSENP